MAETIEVQFGMLRGVGPGNPVGLLHAKTMSTGHSAATVIPLRGVVLLELSSRLKIVVKLSVTLSKINVFNAVVTDRFRNERHM